MSKKHVKSKIVRQPDPRYNDLLCARFINCVMYDGKKSVATRVVYNCMDEIKRRLSTRQGDQRGGDGPNELDILLTAIDNVKPAVEIQSKRVGGATYQVPVRVDPDRATALAIRWILEVTRGKKRPTNAHQAGRRIAGCFTT